MPANLPPQYFEAEKAYRQAKTPEDKVEALETMLAIMPKHKGTDKLRAELRRRIAKFSEEAERRPSTARKGSSYNIRKEGAGQVVMVGFPNAGKSQLMARLTGASTEVAEYPYTTRAPIPGMLKFENTQIQLLDMPPITARDARPWFAHLLRNADLIALVLDLCTDPVSQLEAILADLENMKVKVRKDEAVLLPSVVVKKVLVVASKSALDTHGANLSRLKASAGELPVAAVSAAEGIGLEEFKRSVYDALDIIRVYTKSPGKKPDFDEPVVVAKGSTIEEVAESIHKDLRRSLKYAQVWGSGKYDGQRVNRSFVVEEGDVVELHV